MEKDKNKKEAKKLSTKAKRTLLKTFQCALTQIESFKTLMI